MADPDALIGRATSPGCSIQKLACGMAVVVFLSVCFLFHRMVEAQVKETRRVLILNDIAIVSSPRFAEIDQALFAGLQKSPYQIELYQEALELTLIPDEACQRRFREEFIRKYAIRKPDVIITAGSDSLKFISELHERFVVDTPMSFAQFWGKFRSL